MAPPTDKSNDPIWRYKRAKTQAERDEILLLVNAADDRETMERLLLIGSNLNVTKDEDSHQSSSSPASDGADPLRVVNDLLAGQLRMSQQQMMMPPPEQAPQPTPPPPLDTAAGGSDATGAAGVAPAVEQKPQQEEEKESKKQKKKDKKKKKKKEEPVISEDQERDMQMQEGLRREEILESATMEEQTSRWQEGVRKLPSQPRPSADAIEVDDDAGHRFDSELMQSDMPPLPAASPLQQLLATNQTGKGAAAAKPAADPLKLALPPAPVVRKPLAWGEGLSFGVASYALVGTAGGLAGGVYEWMKKILHQGPVPRGLIGHQFRSIAVRRMTRGARTGGAVGALFVLGSNTLGALGRNYPEYFSFLTPMLNRQSFPEFGPTAGGLWGLYHGIKVVGLRTPVLVGTTLTGYTFMYASNELAQLLRHHSRVMSRHRSLEATMTTGPQHA